jgi:hypothetical protein
VETHRSGTQNNTINTQPPRTQGLQPDPNQQNTRSFLSENRKENQRKQKNLHNPKESEEQNTTENSFGGTKLPTLMVGRKKLQSLRAWSTKDREEGGVKPPSLGEHVSEKKTLSLSLES